MDVGALSAGLAAASISAQTNVSVLKTAQNLEEDLVARLFSSIGLGAGFDSFA